MGTTDTTVQAAGGEDMRIAFGGFSIGGLVPGDYVMRAVVSVDGKPVGRVMRTLRKIAQQENARSRSTLPRGRAR